MATVSSPELDNLLRQLSSLDAEERFEAINGLKKYAGHRKVMQAVFDHRNDSDRRIRHVAREILDEGEKRTSESLSVKGAVEDEREVRVDELLHDLMNAQPFERVTALKQLEFFLPHPKIAAALQKLKRDPDRTMRMLVQTMIDEQIRKEQEGEKIQRNEIRDGVMVASPYSAKKKMAWKEQTAGRLGPELVPYVGLFYVVVMLPIALLVLWVWADSFGVVDPTVAPDPAIKAFVHTVLFVKLDAFSLVIVFTLCAIALAGGVGTMFRHEWGRRAILLFHALLVFRGLFLPSPFAKLTPFGLSAIVLYYLTRREIVQTFKGNEHEKTKEEKSNYGDMDRKVW